MYKSFVMQSEDSLVNLLSQNYNQVSNFVKAGSSRLEEKPLLDILASSFEAVKLKSSLSTEESQLLRDLFYQILLIENDLPGFAVSIISTTFPLIKELPRAVCEALVQDTTSFLLSQQIQAPTLRLQLATEFNENKDFDMTIRLLAEFVHEYHDFNLCQLCILLAEAFSEKGENQQAEQFLHRCANAILGDIPVEWKLRYRIATSELCDYRRKYIDACRRFMSLSMDSNLSEERRSNFLTRSILMAILSPAGQLRFRLLASLYVDERSKISPLFQLLEKMYMGRLLKEEDMDILAPFLAMHHKTGSNNQSVSAALSSDLSLVDLIILEHNMFSANLLYNNISLVNLAKLLKVTPEIAESVACRMISEGRMAGSIDQIDGIVYFEKMNAMSRWDAHIYDICQTVNSAFEKLVERYPEWAVISRQNPSTIKTHDS